MGLISTPFAHLNIALLNKTRDWLLIVVNAKVGILRLLPSTTKLHATIQIHIHAHC